MTLGVTPRLLETLRHLGLTEYSARSYVALLTLKAAEASAVAEAAEVPRTKVYAALKDLVDAGWVSVSGGRPLLYRPVAPEPRIAQEEERLTRRIDDATRELHARFSTAGEMIPASIYLLRGEAALVAKTEELLARARDEVFLNLGFALPGEERALGERLLAARRRGVRLKLMLGPLVDAAALGAVSADARAAHFPFRALVIDRRQGFLVLPGEEPVGLWNPSKESMELLAPALLRAWENAPSP